MTGVLVVVGSGPGIGVTTASLFATKGFKAIALLARSADRLKTDAATVRAAHDGVRVETYTANTGDSEKLDATLKQVEKDLGAPEVVLYNAARIAPATIAEEPPASVRDDLMNMAVGLYVVISWAKPHLEAVAKDSAAHPCFFLSGSAIGDIPLSPLFSLSMSKAAQQSLMRSFGQVVGPAGVHVAYTSIDGQVSDAEPELNAKNIANMYWQLHQESPNNWRDRVVIGDWAKANPWAAKK